MRSNQRHGTLSFGQTAFAAPVGPAEQKDARSSALSVVVLYTTPEATKAALRYAATLGRGLSVKLSLLDIEVVPFACPMDRPPINPDFARRRLESLAEDDDASFRAEIIYARDRDEALVRRLGPGSLVLIPVKGFWHRMVEKRLVRKLMKYGHDVVLVPCN